MTQKNLYTSKVRKIDTILYRESKRQLEEENAQAVGLYFKGYNIYEGNLILNGDYIKIFPIWIPGLYNRQYYTGWIAAFDIKKIKPNSSISIKIPKQARGLFEGPNKIIEEWCTKLGVKSMEVV